MLYREAHALKDEASQLEQYIVFDILGRSQAVLCTLVGSANNLLKGHRFKTTFIDEAAQSLEAASWIPIIRSERVIMAGDHQQLPPTIKSFEAARQGLRFSLFEKIIQRKEELATPVDAMLRKQYRMNKKIMHFSSEYFYNHNLIADESVSEHVIHENLPPLLFIDTVGSGFAEQIDEKTLSTYNREEGLALLEHLNQAIGEIGVERMLEEHITIGVIAPYRAQIRLLKAESEQYEAIQQVTSLLSIDTVDAFQGRERDMMYISLVRSNEKGVIGFLGEIRRTNVAMTRARKRLVMMGDSATLSNHPFFQQLVAYCQENNAYESIFEIMQF
jgi:superfamily I DNA and/or RNA helicase